MHHVVVGLTWLKKRLAALRLKRRNVVETRLTLGHQAIKIHCDDATGSTVMDPIASRLRKVKRLTRRTYVNKGPNWCWHIDGYDKLKPFGFPIHACIDGCLIVFLWSHL
ncbi:hypothetical protein EMCRGX_G030062 [Ephydatia muelleri]